MKLIFVDEVYGSKSKDFFGLGVLVTDSSKYAPIRNSFYKTLEAHGWPDDREIKGKYCFSRDPEDTGKTPEEMIALSKDLTGNLMSKRFARAELLFAFGHKPYSVDQYIHLLTAAISKIARPQSKKNGKHLATCSLDDFSNLRANEKTISAATAVALMERGYCLIEETVTTVKSSNRTPGILYADLLAYLARWIAENPELDPESLPDISVPAEGATSVKKVAVARSLLFDRIKGYLLKVE